MSRYFSTVGLSVSTGDIAVEGDINNLVDTLDASFGSVQTDLDNINTTATASAITAQKWAENPEDTEVTAGHYSALHHAAKAAISDSSASASASIATTKAGEASTSASNASGYSSSASASASTASTKADITIAQVVLTASDVISTHADVVLTHADVVSTHADVVLTHADVSTMSSAITTALQSQSVTMASKTLTSPIFNTDISGSAIDTLVTTSTSKIPRSGAVKTYVDTAIAALPTYYEGTIIGHLSDKTVHTATEFSNSGRYIRIGNMVIFSLELIMSSLGTLTTSSQASISIIFSESLVFSPLATYGGSVAKVASVSKSQYGAITFTTFPNTPYLDLWQFDLTTGISPLLISEVTAGGQLTISGSAVVELV